MKIVIETFVTIFFITLAVFVGTQIIGSQLQISNAKEFHNNVIKGVEDSGFDVQTIKEFKKKAGNLGYKLEVDISGEDSIRCSDCNSSFKVEESLASCKNCKSMALYVEDGNRRGLVSLTYDIVIPLLNIKQQGTQEGYVR